MRYTLFTSTALVSTLLFLHPAMADSRDDMVALKHEIELLKHHYEHRISELETKLAQLEERPKPATTLPVVPVPASPPTPQPTNTASASSFNPAIGAIFNGRFSNFSASDAPVKGFGIGEEGVRGKEGLGLDESELNFSGNIDDKFKGSLTASIVEEDGSDTLELEESYIKTLPGAGLPTGMEIKAGRAFWNLGYLNERHAHTDDFADRPLPTRAFLNSTFNDDGVELSYTLPTPFFIEVGGGLFRGDDFPGGSASGEGASSHSVFARVGGDIGTKQSWRLGGTWLDTTTKDRVTNDDVVHFSGDSNLYIADARYDWTITDNPVYPRLSLQGEYFHRTEDGTYLDNNADTGLVGVNDHASGWYGQAVYQFAPSWRTGYRYTSLKSPSYADGLKGSLLDANGYDPYINSAMLDWTNSEFSRIRLQYNLDNSVQGRTDNQVILQYIMSIGAHRSHKY